MIDARAWLKGRYPQLDGLNADITIAIVELMTATTDARLDDVWDAFYSWSNGVDDDDQFKERMNTLLNKEAI